jgi:hypothetical protein
LEDALLLLVGRAAVGVDADTVDGLDQVGQSAGLLDDAVSVELDDQRHLRRGRVPRGAGANLADVGDLLDRLDGQRRDVALVDLVDARQEINTQDGGQDRGCRGRDKEPECDARLRAGPHRLRCSGLVGCAELRHVGRALWSGIIGPKSAVSVR